jgi:alpha-amylase
MKKFLVTILCVILLLNNAVNAQTTTVWNGKVVLQCFWWDYYNSNYPNAWSNYLADLAPRLKQMGIDAVWIPPFYKNGSSTSNGYAPFDHYDLGDKYQKGNTGTRMGNKDELLRLIAVMHANGIEVIEDIVLNHMDGAGSASGDGGQDPSAYEDNTTSKYKNFRYTSYSSPATDESFNDYTNRKGRWSANWTNFYPNQFNNHYNTGVIDQILFGPDISYESSAYGQSSNALYNPVQNTNYMRENARNWLVWLKKQTAVDGFRFDAAKHYPQDALQDFLWNVKYGASWANGGQQLFAVGEYIGTSNEMDTWINTVKNSNSGTEDLIGTFDFSLRQALKDMTSANGAYDLGTIPSAQQTNRYRTVPFVNNHDTYRPMKDVTGNIIGWDSGNEIGGHIEAFDGRLSAAYAIAFAVDGSPQVFFEDLLNVGSTGKRYSHLPTSITDLPVNSDIANIIACHQQLQFKKGTYKVRWQAADLLVIERGYNAGPENSYAIIGVNDNWTTWQNALVQTDFGPNVQLHDYSGANTADIYTDGNGMATIYVPPCDGSNTRRGYCIWGQVNAAIPLNSPVNSVTQEWEMAQNLGDSHLYSLQQGGELPTNSEAYRYVGELFSDANKLITLNLFQTISSNNVTLELRNHTGTILQTVADTGALQLTYLPPQIGFYSIYIKNSNLINTNQPVFVKANYTAPLVANTAQYPTGSMIVNSVATATNEQNQDITVYPTILSKSATIIFTTLKSEPVKISVFSIAGQELQVLFNDLGTGAQQQLLFENTNLSSGIYFIKMQTPTKNLTTKIAIVKE